MKSVADVFRKDETTKMINGVEASCLFLVFIFLTAANDAINRGRSRRNSRSQLTLLLINPRLICGTVSSSGLTTRSAKQRRCILPRLLVCLMERVTMH